MRRLVLIALAISPWLFLGPFAFARDLTFEDRVNAQEVIERVYYSHQIGATKPFEEAVPRAVLEEKVRTYLKESIALQQSWHTQLTSYMLQVEVQRMARSTRAPERLQELYAALGNDPYLIEECLGRQVLVDRLTRYFFAYDQTIHANTRAEAEDIRRKLLSGEINAKSPDPRRMMFELRSTDGQAVTPSSVPRGAGMSEPDQEPDDGTSDETPRRFTGRAGEVGPVVEERGAFVIQVGLGGGTAQPTRAMYRVPKISRGDWWQEVEGVLDESGATAVASETGVLPTPAGSVPVHPPEIRPRIKR
jgi:hypothetical protein